MSENTENEESVESGVSVKTRLEKPKMYKVLMLNDDFTTMEFVVLVLMKFFKKNRAESQEIMLKIHKDGLGVCGVYTKEVAESKVAKVEKYAKKNSYPLKLTYEEEE